MIFNIYYTKACIELQQILRSHYDTLKRATQGSLSNILSKLYTNNVITESVKDSESQSYSKMMQEFNTKLSLSEDVSELKRHCQVFLECISQGGPTDDAARTLAIEWGKVFDMKSLPVASTMTSPHTPSPPSNTGHKLAMKVFAGVLVILAILFLVILTIQFHSGNTSIHASNLKINNDTLKNEITAIQLAATPIMNIITITICH